MSGTMVEPGLCPRRLDGLPSAFRRPGGPRTREEDHFFLKAPGSDEPLVRPFAAPPDSDGYVATPQGYRHHSCIYEVPSGSEVDGAEVRLNGQIIARVPRCKYPRRTARLATASAAPGVINKLPGL
jgi:hypothetical protein